jgi:hypothetical protein
MRQAFSWASPFLLIRRDAANFEKDGADDLNETCIAGSSM